MNPAPRIAVHGAYGRLGSLIVNELAQHSAGTVERDGAIPQCDVIIDVSSPQGTADLLSRLSNQALVVGTTGDLPMVQLRQYATQAPVAIVPNFSVGIPLLLELIEHAMRVLPEGWHIEVVEAHHAAKKDAPSGTAKRLVQAIGRDVPSHSLRVGDTFGEHTVWMCGPGERLELKHVATRREVFSIGAVRWAKWLAQQPVGLHCA